MLPATKFALLRMFLTGLLFFSPFGMSQAQQSFTGAGKMLEEIRASIPNISTEELKAALESDPNTVLIDVRTVREANLTGGIIRAKRSVTIPRGWLEFRIGDAVSDKDAPIVVYCGTNRRSPLALLTLKRLGYTNVRNYADGFPAWRDAGYPVESPDIAPESFLYAKPIKVAEGVWSAIGATQPSTYQNSGHNNNLSFVVTSDGVFVFNAGGSWLLARSLHDEIKKITNQPVKYVALENGQGHAALGASYWREQGVPIIAHEEAAEQITHGRERIVASVKRVQKDKAYGTSLVDPDITFTDKKVFEMGDTRIELLNLGPAHSPGDIMLWLPQKKLVIAGDMAFHERMLPVFEHTDTGAWIETWKAFEGLGAKIVIPGHGGPTTIDVVRKYTRDYLVFLRGEIQKVLDDDGDLVAAYEIDQSAYEHMDVYELLYLRNVRRIFDAMEFE